VVLLLFAVMLTRAPIGASADHSRPLWPGLLVGGGTGLGLAVLFVTTYGWTAVEFGEPGSAGLLGAEIFGNWVLPFEVLSILLLAALIGAIVVSRPDLPVSR
jgi:NADH-quinone oxidoreductase subunit J